ncbi:MAG: hypothetical protein AAF125_15790 [Chloroflexota bacterium]
MLSWYMAMTTWAWVGLAALMTFNTVRGSLRWLNGAATVTLIGLYGHAVVIGMSPDALTFRNYDTDCYLRYLFSDSEFCEAVDLDYVDALAYHRLAFFADWQPRAILPESATNDDLVIISASRDWTALHIREWLLPPTARTILIENGGLSTRYTHPNVRAARFVPYDADLPYFISADNPGAIWVIHPVGTPPAIDLGAGYTSSPETTGNVVLPGGVWFTVAHHPRQPTD